MGHEILKTNQTAHSLFNAVPPRAVMSRQVWVLGRFIVVAFDRLVGWLRVFAGAGKVWPGFSQLGVLLLRRFAL